MIPPVDQTPFATQYANGYPMYMGQPPFQAAQHMNPARYPVYPGQGDSMNHMLAQGSQGGVMPTAVDAQVMPQAMMPNPIPQPSVPMNGSSVAPPPPFVPQGPPVNADGSPSGGQPVKHHTGHQAPQPTPPAPTHTIDTSTNLSRFPVASIDGISNSLNQMSLTPPKVCTS